MNVFVLMDCSENNICSDVVGVFDHADITDDDLRPYFGEGIERTSFEDVRDSGVEWIMHIRSADYENARLVLHEYQINEI